MRNKIYWIKERQNPQLGTYFVAMGALPTKAARKHEDSLYGSNVMHPFKGRESYEARIKELREKGESF